MSCFCHAHVVHVNAEMHVLLNAGDVHAIVLCDKLQAVLLLKVQMVGFVKWGSG